MELKKYQDKVIKDLVRYLEIQNETGTMSKAWEKYWNEKGAAVGYGGVARYDNSVGNAPHVCMKVPTGGGKTFLACCAVKKIFDAIGSWGKPRFVVWLVPSDAILEQTVRNLKNADHPYRQRLNLDAKGRVEVYTKDELLFAQNFSPDTVRENLTIAVMSYASVRIDKTKKDSRKVYQENGNLMRFAQFFKDKEALLADTPDTALIQVLRYFEPVVIVDESHNAVADLSVEMIQNLNPSFVLDLTATTKNSNVISYVTPAELKKENMVKLPVVVYNRNSRESVIENAILLRKRLEELAYKEKVENDTYIRPIVLFQAQPKNKANSATFESIKRQLTECGIPKEQIAIKTAEINELKNIDLLSEKCQIRYIITVNALKEGWDCPFAYILASLANKTSQIDVEQILGRILRKPYTKKLQNKLLNLSYVFTNSNDFYSTLELIVKALNKSGYGENECVTGENEKIPKTPVVHGTQQTLIPMLETGETEEADDDLENMHLEGVAGVLNDGAGNSEKTDAIAATAEEQLDAYESKEREAESKGESLNLHGQDFQKITKVQPQFEADIANLKIPQFVTQAPNPDLFGSEMKLLRRENLSDTFKLCNLPTNINFDAIDSMVYLVDVEGDGEGVPRYRAAQRETKELLRKQLEHLIPEAQKSYCASLLINRLNKNNRYEARDIKKFIERVLEDMDEDNIAKLKEDPYLYVEKIKKYVEGFEEKHWHEVFFKRLSNGKIFLSPQYSLPMSIMPEPSTTSIPDSLYVAEKKDMNPTEIEVLNSIISKRDIVWWHRIIEKDPQEFRINGFMNHYPDFMMRTRSGKILMIEVKGDHLDGSNSVGKLELGTKWATLAGADYRYFMIFKKRELGIDGAYQLDDFIETMKEI